MGRSQYGSDVEMDVRSNAAWRAGGDHELRFVRSGGWTTERQDALEVVVAVALGLDPEQAGALDSRERGRFGLDHRARPRTREHAVLGRALEFWDVQVEVVGQRVA